MALTVGRGAHVAGPSSGQTTLEATLFVWAGSEPMQRESAPTMRTEAGKRNTGYPGKSGWRERREKSDAIVLQFYGARSGGVQSSPVAPFRPPVHSGVTPSRGSDALTTSPLRAARRAPPDGGCAGARAVRG